MIISHKHKFIFIKTRKTAGSSLEIALSSICGLEDIITPLNTEEENLRRTNPAYRSAQNYRVPFKNYGRHEVAKALYRLKPVEYYTHNSAENIRQYIGREIFDSYFKFAVDRNPFDKVVSMFYYTMGIENSVFENITDFIDAGELQMLSSYDMYSIDKKIVVDKIYKYEELESALIDLTKRFNLEIPLTLPAYKAKGNFRKKKSYKDFLSEEERRRIEIIYAREIKLLDYSF